MEQLSKNRTRQRSLSQRARPQVIVDQFAAELLPTEHCSFEGYGNVQLNVFDTEATHLSVELHDTLIENGTVIDIILCGILVASISPVDGQANERFEFSVPFHPISKGDIVTLEFGEKEIYCGRFNQRDPRDW